MLSNSMSNLFKNAGVSQILDRQKIEGTTAFTAAMISDSLLSVSNVLPQIETWVNRYIFYSIGKVNSHVTYLKVTPYTKGEVFNKALSAAEFGIPTKIMAASLIGLDPYQSFAMNYLEENVLELSDKWVPLQSTHTQSGNPQSGDDPMNKGGRPKNNGDMETDITSESRTETSTTVSKKSSTTVSE